MSHPHATPAPRAGVIHDIGYRHYAGARLGRGAIVRALFVDSLRGAFGLGRSARSKVTPLLLFALICAPAAIMAVGMAVQPTDAIPLGYHEYARAVGILLSLFVATQAPVLVSRDLRFRVISLYLSRPLRRNDYVFAKVAAMTAAVWLLVAVPLLIVYAGALLAKLAWWPQTRNLLIALVGVLIFAVILAVFSLLVAALTPRRGIGVAAIVTLLIGSIGGSATAQELAKAQNADTAAGYLGLCSPFSLAEGVQSWVLRTPPPTPFAPPGALGGAVFTAVAIAVVLVGIGLLVLRYRKVSVS